MRYLALALFAEGPTDHAFLRPLLRRLCETVCAENGRAPIEVGDVLELHSPTGATEEDRGTRVFLAASEAAAGWHILFVHTDGAGDPEAAWRERVEPACGRIRNGLPVGEHRPVGVVPVRETEAWALANGNALRDVFGTNAEDGELGIPVVPKDVEVVADPKRALEAAYAAAQGGRKGRRRRKAASLLEVLGERVRLSVLAGVPAFATLRANLQTALAESNYL